MTGVQTCALPIFELSAGSGLWKAFRQRETEPFAGSDNDKSKQSGSGETGHYVNFIDGVRSGKNETLHCDINDGFYSSALPALANISYRLGRSLKYDNKTRRFVNDAEADLMLTRDYRKPYVVPDKV